MNICKYPEGAKAIKRNSVRAKMRIEWKKLVKNIAKRDPQVPCEQNQVQKAFRKSYISVKSK